MFFKDVIDNFIAPIYLDQPDGWDYLLVKLTVLEGTGVEHVNCDSASYQFDMEIFNPMNYYEGWPSGRYDNYTIVPNRLILKPRDEFGRYVIQCVLISPWFMDDVNMFHESLDEIRAKDVLLYNDIKQTINDEKLLFL